MHPQCEQVYVGLPGVLELFDLGEELSRALLESSGGLLLMSMGDVLLLVGALEVSTEPV